MPLGFSTRMSSSCDKAGTQYKRKKKQPKKYPLKNIVIRTDPLDHLKFKLILKFLINFENHAYSIISPFFFKVTFTELDFKNK